MRILHGAEEVERALPVWVLYGLLLKSPLCEKATVSLVGCVEKRGEARAKWSSGLQFNST
jgi:hypothetical protein